MSERSEYVAGEFCWVDLATPDLEGSQAFYSGLFGWTTVQAGAPEDVGGYSFFTAKGKSVAGIGPVQTDGQPPVWTSYVNVADADQVALSVSEAEGTMIMEPFDVPNAGRMAVFQDPTGAFFSVWQASGHRGAQLVNEPGSWTWNELNTRDADGAKDFYGKVFGWTAAGPESQPAGIDYSNWHVDGERWEEGIGGLIRMTEDWPDEIPPHWQVYFAVEDADAIAARAKELGGMVMVEPNDVGIGRIAILGDPLGAFFGIFQGTGELER